MTHQLKRDLTTILALGILIMMTTSSPADDRYGDDGLEGWFVGINAGFGDSFTAWEEGKRSTSEEGEFGAMGGLRIGYAINSHWAISLEGYGHGTRDHDELDDDIGLGVGFFVGTWHPTGDGFFVRLGFGAGGGEFVHPETRERVELDERFAGLFGLGYDWRVGRNTALGVAFDGFALDADGATGFENDTVGAGMFSIQFTWHP